MKFLLPAFSLAVCLSATATFAQDPIRTTADSRVWQTVMDESAPLEWRWRKHAAKADLIVTNLLTKTVVTSSVVRVEGAASGQVAMPNPSRSADTGEGLEDVALVQYDATEAVLSVETARLAFLPQTIALEQSTTPRFGRACAPRVVSYDSLWNVATLNAQTATLVLGEAPSATEQALPTVGGYFELSAADQKVQVKFDDSVTPALSASVVVPRGLCIVVL